MQTRDFENQFNPTMAMQFNPIWHLVFFFVLQGLYQQAYGQFFFERGNESCINEI